MSDCEELVGGLLTGDDEVGLVQKKQSKRVQIVCSRTTRARRKICQFYAISLQKPATGILILRKCTGTKKMSVMLWLTLV